MKKRMIFIFLNVLFSFSFVFASHFYYNVSLTYDDGALDINSVDVVYLTRDEENLFGEYSLEFRGLNDRVIEEARFDIPNFYIYDDFESGAGIEYLDFVSFSVFVPYSEDVVGIFLYNGSREIEKRDVYEYAEKDVFDLVKNDNKSDFDNEEIKTKDSNYMIYYFFLFITILIILFIILYISFNKKKSG
jgi:hypothetical protein